MDDKGKVAMALLMKPITLSGRCQCFGVCRITLCCASFSVRLASFSKNVILFVPSLPLISLWKGGCSLSISSEGFFQMHSHAWYPGLLWYLNQVSVTEKCFFSLLMVVSMTLPHSVVYCILWHPVCLDCAGIWHTSFQSLSPLFCPLRQRALE